MVDVMLRARERGFDALVQCHREGLLRHARNMCRGSEADPEDLVHDTLEMALRSFDKLDGQPLAVVGGYLNSALAHRFIDRCRHRRVEVMGMNGLTAVQEPFTMTEAAVELWRRLSDEELKTAMSRLRHALRQAYRLRLAGLSYDEIAETMGVPRGTVASWLSQAREELRRMLVDRGSSAGGEGEP